MRSFSTLLLAAALQTSAFAARGPVECARDVEVIGQMAGVVVSDFEGVVKYCTAKNATECGKAIDTLADELNAVVDNVDKAGTDCGFESPACAAAVDSTSKLLDTAVKGLTDAAVSCQSTTSKFQCVEDLARGLEKFRGVVKSIEAAQTACKK